MDSSSDAQGGHGAPAVVACLMTFPDEDRAVRIGRALVEERLAACVNLLPAVRSIYRWQGAVSDDTEVMAVAKTTRDRLPDLIARVIELHPYDVPEVIAIEVVAGSERYLDWARDSVRSDERVG